MRYFLIKHLLLCFAILILVSSGGHTQEHPWEPSPEVISPLDTTEGGYDHHMWRLLDEWRTDTIGCQGLRNLYKIKLMVYYLSLDRRTGKEVQWALGKPNNIKQYGIDEHGDMYYGLRYHYDVKCENGRMLNANTCDVEFVVSDRSDSVVRVGYRCSGG